MCFCLKSIFHSLSFYLPIFLTLLILFPFISFSFTFLCLILFKYLLLEIYSLLSFYLVSPNLFFYYLFGSFFLITSLILYTNCFNHKAFFKVRTAFLHPQTSPKQRMLRLLLLKQRQVVPVLQFLLFSSVAELEPVGAHTFLTSAGAEIFGRLLLRPFL